MALENMLKPDSISLFIYTSGGGSLCDITLLHLVKHTLSFGHEAVSIVSRRGLSEPHTINMNSE